jgi:hypothetical protein
MLGGGGSEMHDSASGMLNVEPLEHLPSKVQPPTENLQHGR